MGQFASKEYDGDPYVDLMRALPERELIWWVQKAIWVSADTATINSGCATEAQWDANLSHKRIDMCKCALEMTASQHAGWVKGCSNAAAPGMH